MACWVCVFSTANQKVVERREEGGWKGDDKITDRITVVLLRGGEGGPQNKPPQLRESESEREKEGRWFWRRSPVFVGDTSSPSIV